MNKYYTGIGSRKTPKDICDRFSVLAEILFKKGFILRSGAADGADLAFEKLIPENNKEIYIPWKGFNGSKSVFYNIPEESFEIAADIHPAWDKCSDGAKRLHARNINQILGNDLKTPSEFVVCWTENGEDVGGTRTAIILAKERNIPVFNFGSCGRVDKDLWDFIK